MMAFLVWGLLACSAGYWSIQLLARPLPVPADAGTATAGQGPLADLGRLLGSDKVAELAPVSSRYQLLGAVAPKSAGARAAGEGVALIAVDGVPRTVRVGALLDGGLRLLSVDARSASLGEGGVVSQKLQLLAPAPATTGALAPAAPSPTVLGGNPGSIPVAAAPLPMPAPGLPQGPQPAPGNPPADLPLR
ncbi:MAG: hypothetical protein ABW005_02545 [Burkholderiaceae bacterium]